MESPTAAPQEEAANDPAEQIEALETELSGSGAEPSVEAVFELLDLDGDGTVTLDGRLFDRCLIVLMPILMLQWCVYSAQWLGV